MKKMLMLVLMIFISICITSCAGINDWTYTLPNDYEVWHINSKEILIKCVDLESNGDKIPSFVKEFSYNERYVFSRNVENILNNDILDEVYYALDTKEKKVYGPFDSIEQLKVQVQEWDIKLPEKWYRTSPDPNMNE